jgi:hypothetical protein
LRETEPREEIVASQTLEKEERLPV